MGNFKVYTTFNKYLGQTSSACKTQFWGPLTENLNPLQRPTHTLTPPSINTQNRSKTTYWLIMTCIELCVIGQKFSITWKSEDLAILSFKRNSSHTHQNRLKSSPVSERSAYSLQNYICFSPLTSGLESFGQKSTPPHRPWIEAYCP